MKSLSVSGNSPKHADRCMQARGYSTNAQLGAYRLEECAVFPALNGLSALRSQDKVQGDGKASRACLSHTL